MGTSVDVRLIHFAELDPRQDVAARKLRQRLPEVAHWAASPRRRREAPGPRLTTERLGTIRRPQTDHRDSPAGRSAAQSDPDLASRRAPYQTRSAAAPQRQAARPQFEAPGLPPTDGA